MKDLNGVTVKLGQLIAYKGIDGIATGEVIQLPDPKKYDPKLHIKKIKPKPVKKTGRYGQVGTNAVSKISSKSVVLVLEKQKSCDYCGSDALIWHEGWCEQFSEAA